MVFFLGNKIIALEVFFFFAKLKHLKGTQRYVCLTNGK